MAKVKQVEMGMDIHTGLEEGLGAEVEPSLEAPTPLKMGWCKCDNLYPCRSST